MSGWKLVPVEANDRMIDAGADDVVKSYGDHPEWEDATDMAENLATDPIWSAMTRAAPSPPEDVLERMARAGDAEDAAQCGEPSPWLAPGVELTGEMAKEYQEFRAARIAVYRAALAAAEERKDD